jgi:hypothetical protein
VACLEADFVLSLPTHQGTYYTFGIICMLGTTRLSFPPLPRLRLQAVPSDGMGSSLISPFNLNLRMLSNNSAALFIVWLPNVLNFLPCLKSKLL